MAEKEFEYFSTFHEVTRAVLSALDLEAVLGLITKAAVSSLEIKGSTLMLLDEKSHRLELVASHGLSQKYLEKGPLYADRSIADASRGKPVLVENAPADDRVQYRQEAREEGIASILSVPMVMRGQFLGVLRIYTREPRQFSENEMDLISAIAEIGAIAIENARIFEARGAELSKVLKVGGIDYEYQLPVAKYQVKPTFKGGIEHKKSYDYFRTLYRLTRTITSAMEMKKTLEAVVSEIAKSMQVKGCCLFWLNTVSRELELLASYGLSHAYVCKGPLSIDKSVPQVFEELTVFIDDVRTDPAVQYPKAADQEGILSMLSVPIAVREKVRGVLRLYSSMATAFSTEDLEFAKVLAEIGGIAIMNAKLHQERTTDITFWKTTLDYLGIENT
jgi:signal transduction protein with GAF and PtsI domain